MTKLPGAGRPDLSSRLGLCDHVGRIGREIRQQSLHLRRGRRVDFARAKAENIYSLRSLPPLTHLFNGSRMTIVANGRDGDDGRNMRIEYRWSLGNAEDSRKYAAELVALAPDVVLANGAQTLGPLRQVTRTVPIVFVGVADPVGAGYVILESASPAGLTS